MNYHSDKWIMDKIREHYNEALEYFPEDRIICLALQGSQNYGLETNFSDVDTKLILTPSFRDIAMNCKPISTTHVRANDEHTDWKDLRLMFNTFRSQNLNFLEVLFTPYFILNPIYASEWNRLIEHREEIAHYNPTKAVKSMWGMAHTKYNQMEHNSPSHAKDIEQYGYSPKELHHLLRIEEYITRYINGEAYINCLVSEKSAYLRLIKAAYYGLHEARWIAKNSIDYIDEMVDKFVNEHPYTINKDVDELLDDVQYNIMKIAIKKEIGD